ncbi:MAG: hypothetical protein BWY15_01711 [Firmicutes bacterium ADurb.Bin193]|nr:MAG: hypothetical protein BWY15_01711 [Firmicutes bacterium ADurb.Bin193]
MRRIVAMLLLFSVLTVSAFNSYVFSAPTPITNILGFQPDGTPYQFCHFGDEYFDNYKFDNVSVNNGVIISNLPSNIKSDGILRKGYPCWLKA